MTHKKTKERINKKKCNCYSSNRPDIGGDIPAVILDPNKYFNWDAPGKKVAVDECIANEVLSLWKAGIWTRGSCCGHNGYWERSIILNEGEDPKKAFSLVSKQTKLKQWQLVNLVKLPKPKTS
jgi:hypothetical protein